MKWSEFPFIGILMALGLVTYAQAPPSLHQVLTPGPASGPVRNVILMIGDGMGLTQISAGMYASGNRSVLEQFQTIGLHKPYSQSHLVTDSAAGATAFACGIKTYNHAIGVDRDTVPCKTLLEDVRDLGYATGMITTSTLVHATPAAFVAHNAHRANYEAIAEDFADCGLDYYVGGGLRYFRNRDSDDRDLLAEMEARGYIIATYFSDDFAQVHPDTAFPYGFFTAYEDPLTAESGRDYLALATTQGLEFLANRSDKGFFVMVEGAQIDWGGHANNGQYLVAEMQDFEIAIAAALAFTRRHPGTLLLVTADHEAGGCAIQPESTWQELKFGFTTTGHTGTLIPVFAFGTGAELFSGIYENTAIYGKIRALMGW